MKIKLFNLLNKSTNKMENITFPNSDASINNTNDKKTGQKNILSKINLSKKLNFAVLVSGLVLLILGLGKLSTNYMSANKLVCADNNKNLLIDASKVLSSAKSKELKDVVNKIQNLKNYENDANCLNVIVTYYINISDYQNAKSNMEKLEKVYKPSQKFDSALENNYFKNIETLRTDIAFLKTASEQYRKNMDDNPKLWTP